MTEDEQAELSALGERFDEIQAGIEAFDEGDPTIEAEEQRLAEIEQRIAVIQNVTKSYDPQEQALAGCLVYIDQFGAMQIGRGYVKAEDKAALEQLRRGDTEDAGHESDGGMVAASPALQQPDAGYSAALVEELTAIRTAAMRVELANRPAIALAALLYPLVGRIFLESYTSVEAAVEVSGQRRELAPSIKEPAEARPLAAWQTMKEAWGDTLSGQPADLWTWLLDQPTDTLLELLAFVAAANLNGVKVKHDQSKGRLANADRIAEAVDLDMRHHWTADATFLNRLSKAGIAEVLEDAGCASQLVRAVEKAPKAEEVQETEKHRRQGLASALVSWARTHLISDSQQIRSPDCVSGLLHSVAALQTVISTAYKPPF